MIQYKITFTGLGPYYKTLLDSIFRRITNDMFQKCMWKKDVKKDLFTMINCGYVSYEMKPRLSSVQKDLSLHSGYIVATVLQVKANFNAFFIDSFSVCHVFLAGKTPTKYSYVSI